MGDAAAGDPPPILANSFPKSGTHLLTQVLEAIPGVRNYGTFLASLPSITMRERSDASICRSLRGSPRGEMVSAHLFHKWCFEDVIREHGFASFFIYRDPRDIVCSEAHYLTHMNRWHRLHRYFRDAQSDEERIELSIRGLEIPGGAVEYEDIGARFGRYRGWLDHPGTFSVRFRDLTGPGRDAIIRAMLAHYLGCFRTAADAGDLAGLVARASSAIVPERSHTYRQGGGVGTWQRQFNKRHKQLFKDCAGQLLVDLGWEKDFDW